MKPSIHQALVLSLSVLLIAGSGCERRGRAPAKPVAPPTAKTPTNAAPTTPGTTTNTNTGGTTNTTPSTNSGDVIVDVPTDPNEAKLETDANMECKAPAIVGGKISIDEFTKDLKTMNDYLACMGDAGLVLSCTDKADKACTTATLAEDKKWTLDADPKKSKAFDEFTRLANEKDDDVAFITMNARLELSVIRLGKMGLKYNADALKAAGIDPAALIKFGQNDITIGGTLLTIAKSKQALEDNRENIKAMKSVDADAQASN